MRCVEGTQLEELSALKFSGNGETVVNNILTRNFLVFSEH
jgi:hypothetical protein